MDRLQELVRLHRMGTGAREVARLLKMGPNTERDYRAALEAAGLLDGSVDELPELAVLKEAVQRHLAKQPPAQMTSSIADWEPKIIELAKAGLTPKPIYDRLKLEEPDFRGSPRRQSLPAIHLDFGRPMPVSVRAVIGSGWASLRGTGTTRRLHRALDLGLPIGTPILAVDHGIVTHVQSQDIGDAGIWTAVRHPSGITSRYIHLSRTLVKVGQLVHRGERIGLSGDTASPGAPHLHLDLRAPAALLPAIEAAIGRPRSGWGPEMKPFGHSIPGEPLIPVDAYRESVRTGAAAMGIPLRDPSRPRNGTVACRRNPPTMYRRRA